MKLSWFKTVSGFVVLFCCYHAAEYMIVFKNSAAGFLVCQALFFIAAWLIAKWQFGKGFAAWGFSTGSRWAKHLIIGIGMGIFLYTASYLLSLWLHTEKFDGIASMKEVAAPLGLFIFGNLFSSVSEDILTRGYLLPTIGKRTGPLIFVLLSAAIYLLNHIYRLGDGLATYTYLFALGITFAIPLVITKKLWYTCGMHWAGNISFYFLHGPVKTSAGSNELSPNYMLALLAILIIPIHYLLLRKDKAAAE